MVRIFLSLLFLLGSWNTYAKSIVYEVSNGENKLYLAGTIHMLRNQDFPPPAEFEIAYQQSKKIYFETDIQYSKTPEFGQRFAQVMMLPDDKTLKDVLSPHVWSELKSFSEKTQFPLSQFMHFNPAMVSIIITMTETKKMGAEDGVDVYYNNLALKDKKFLGELESADDVITYMKKFSLENPDKIIEGALKDVEHIQDDFERLIHSWKSVDLNALEDDMGKNMQKEMPAAYKSLVIDRNKKWLPQLEKMLSTSDVEMVLVGSLHLSGKNGLLAALKKSGYSVEPLQSIQQ